MRAAYLIITIIFSVFLSQNVFSQENEENTPPPIKVTKGILSKMVEDIDYCILQAENMKLTEHATDGYPKNLAFVVSDVFEIKDMPRKLKGSTQDMLEEASSNKEGIKMAISYNLDKLEKESTPEGVKKAYLIKLHRLQKGLKDLEKTTVRYDAHHHKSNLLSFGASYIGEGFSPPLVINLDKTVSQSISAGLYLKKFNEFKGVDTILFNEGSKDTIPKGLAKQNETKHFKYTSIGVRASFHLNGVLTNMLKYDIKKLDLYATLIAGTTFSKEKVGVFSSIRDSSATATKNGFNLGGTIGARYFMDNNMGFFLEAGYENIGFINMGFTYRFIKDDKKGKKK
ncbi:MAG: hypothetical protein HRT72_00540 [Flavobacteriales bacterium]|nr:hypothetical protein [Flavobacteriales bacterium]